MYKKITSILLLILFILPLHSEGQMGSNQILIEQSVTTPKPFSEITLRLNQLPRQDFSWYVDNTLVSESNNKREITITTGASGRMMDVRVLSEPNRNLVTNIPLYPVYFDVIIEPETYTPNWYNGRPQVVPGASVLLTAFIEEEQYRPYSEYQFEWSRGGRQITSYTRNDRSQIQINISSLGQLTPITLTISRLGIVIGSIEVDIPVMRPQVHFYSVNSLLGTDFSIKLDSISLLGENATVEAVPFFSPDYNLNTKPTWLLDNVRINADEKNPFFVTVERNRRAISQLFFRKNIPNNASQTIQGQINVQN